MQELSFHVSQEVLDLGVKVNTACMSGVDNSGPRSPELRQYIQQELENIRHNLPGANYKQNRVLGGFRDLHTRAGRSNRDYVSSPETLTGLFLKKGRFPEISPLVDIYNLVSLKTRLALGAHDVSKLQGNVILRRTVGEEVFIPLGKNDLTPIFPNEYGYIDERNNNVICRMEVLQCERTKVTSETKDIFLIAQGSANTDQEYVAETLHNVCECIAQYCGGRYTILENNIVA